MAFLGFIYLLMPDIEFPKIYNPEARGEKQHLGEEKKLNKYRITI